MSEPCPRCGRPTVDYRARNSWLESDAPTPPAELCFFPYDETCEAHARDARVSAAEKDRDAAQLVARHAESR
jgi:hypothetical protein